VTTTAAITLPRAMLTAVAGARHLEGADTTRGLTLGGASTIGIRVGADTLQSAASLQADAAEAPAPPPIVVPRSPGLLHRVLTAAAAAAAAEAPAPPPVVVPRSPGLLHRVLTTAAAAAAARPAGGAAMTNRRQEDRAAAVRREKPLRVQGCAAQAQPWTVTNSSRERGLAILLCVA
jgi:hypothetical protein